MNTKFITLLMGMLLLFSCHSSEEKPSKLRIGQFMFTDLPVEITFTKKGKPSLQQQMKYTELSDYQPINSGTYTVEVKAENQLLLKKKIGIGTSGVYTLMLYGILQENPTTNEKTTKTKLHEIVEGEEATTPNGNLPQLKVLNDEFECGKDEAKIRWVHLAAGVEEISAEVFSNQETITKKLPSLTYPKLSQTKALSTFQYSVNWKLKGSKVNVAQEQLTIESQKLYTCFVVGIEGKYIDSLKVVTGETAKKKF
ncbi:MULTISPECIES: DUF4397 domain-containing protein [Mesonia]|uniref:Uncharacterized protein n=1 Tax=Mesonia oceanica TaxID=2687242 RepID=A0AC61Y2W7_9FLAO|nr:MULTISPECIES: DUF4397 domain-containing protein [Mesonia]VVU98814.1 hypothetical protein FVB9532_00060 [Mesonia oceanica]|tara:strand:- start:31596 stop:32357 length:762 start_codon:yes stop_codon:yes gene_type:complete